MELIYIIITLFIIYFVYSKSIEQFTDVAGCPEISKNAKTPNGVFSDDPGTAAEACRQISSEAQKITALAKGANNLVQTCMGIWNPKNYTSGDNEATTYMRNIINNNLSTEEQNCISNSCINSSTSVQKNIIDNTNCIYCNTHDCSISNVTQENTLTSDQNCTIQSGIEMLMSKTNSISAQALGQALQKAQGLLSGSNTVVSDNCNIVNTDMSSKKYLTQISKCVNNISNDQTNSLKGCATVSNVIQRNKAEQIQLCISKATTTSSDTTNNKSEAVSKSIFDQTTTGIDLTGLVIIGIICLLSCCSSSSSAAYLYV